MSFHPLGKNAFFPGAVKTKAKPLPPCRIVFLEGSAVKNMANYRAVRVGDEIKTKISEIIPTLKDPRINGIVSVTRVEVSHDSKYARVYISALGDEAHLAETVKGFQSSAGYIRRALAASMQLRNTPELKFVADKGLVRGQRTIELMRELSESEQKKEISADEQSEPADARGDGAAHEGR